MHVNNDFQKNSNISQVFETLWKNPEISRIDIAKKLNLYRSTVSNIIGTLLENNIIQEGVQGKSADKGGRKPVFLSINKSFGCIIGMELQSDYYNVVALTFDGEQFYSKTGKMPDFDKHAPNSHEQFIKLLDFVINEITPDIKKFTMPLLVMSVGIPGIVDVDKGVIIRSEPFGLVNFNYAELLSHKYEIPLFFENDARCCGWLQGSKKSDEKEDFICVLTKAHSEQGIGVGLSISIGGHIINGHNYAVGEYVSKSWTETKGGQTGLPQAVVSSVCTVDDSYKEWLTDLFATLTITIPILSPQIVYLHGQSDSKKDFILKVIHENVAQFEAVLARYDSKLVIMPEDPLEIARGAGVMLLQRLFELPYTGITDSYSSITWDDLFAIQKKASA